MIPMHEINRPGGSLGRSQACNLALRLYGDERITDDVLKTWLDRLYRPQRLAQHRPQAARPARVVLRRRRLLLLLRPLVRRPVHRRAARRERPYFQDHLAHILLPLQERDGSWWDYPFYNYHQQYGTAMAVMSLLRCEHSESEPSRRRPGRKSQSVVASSIAAQTTDHGQRQRTCFSNVASTQRRQLPSPAVPSLCPSVPGHFCPLRRLVR